MKRLRFPGGDPRPRIALIALLLVTAACSQQPTSQPTSSPSPTPDPLAFTQCMRDKGIDMDDPDPDSGRPVPGEGVDPQGEAYQAAMQDCQHLLPGSESEESADPGKLKAYQAYAECMRKNGMPDFPDPQPGEQGNFGKLDRTNPNFDKANQACQDVLAGAGQ
jgi:hypothetical protein